VVGKIFVPENEIRKRVRGGNMSYGKRFGNRKLAFEKTFLEKRGVKSFSKF